MKFDLSGHMAKRERLHDPVRDRIWKRAEMETAKHEAEIHLHIKTVELDRAEAAFQKAIAAHRAAKESMDAKTKALAAFDEGTRAYINLAKRG